ncbi:MAG: hypothetical protein IKI10_01550 [Muribaculaceae bacterium]|nr:hypothetical protein [Muribaculaceae bacterium]
MMTLIGYITLLVAAMLDMLVMLGMDMQAMQASGYSNRKYNNWLRESGELSSFKRVLVLAVLIGTCTTMAQMSWMVVVILAAVLLVQGIVLLRSWLGNKTLAFDRRAAGRYFTAIFITLIILAATGYLGYRSGSVDAAHAVAIMAVMILAITPLLTMLTNWLLKPFGKLSNSDEGEGS